MFFLTPALIINLSWVVAATCPSTIDIILPEVIEAGTEVPLAVNTSIGGVVYDVHIDGKRTITNRTKSTTTVKLGQRAKELMVSARSTLTGCGNVTAERRVDLTGDLHLPSTRSALPWLIALLATVICAALVYGTRH